MIRISTLAFMLSAVCTALDAQVNLVPNPSFEDTLRCPASINQSLTCAHWSSYGGTPDYFNECANPTASIWIPTNVFGQEHAATGKGYCGLIAYMKPGVAGTNVREHIGTKLISPLVKGTKYHVSFKVSLADGAHFDIKTATNKLGVKFLMQPLVALSNGTVFNSAHVFTNVVMTDTSGWTKIQGSFIADTNYRYLACGNFFDDANTSVQYLGNPNQQAYYYVDDFRVSTDSAEVSPTAGLPVVDQNAAFDVYPNPAGDQFTLRMHEATPADVSVLNALGGCVVQTRTSGQTLTIDTSRLPEGIYFVRIASGNRAYFNRLFVRH